ncbi:hypothetical protein LCGC14_1485020 [marine sediment metagenome]|uniref:Uncharacterized protein n=1 Tax=marine sediment metagenome TaxID=412755 RepID=A0A0F9MA99_9ZZZZ
MGELLGPGRTYTRVTIEGGTTRTYYYSTNVVTFDEDTITLDTGGYRTALIRAHMNQAAFQYALSFYVDQRNQDWFVRTWAGTVPFKKATLTLDRSTLIMP